jgi:hypothetical protein
MPIGPASTLMKTFWPFFAAFSIFFSRISSFPSFFPTSSATSSTLPELMDKYSWSPIWYSCCALATCVESWASSWRTPAPP